MAGRCSSRSSLLTPGCIGNPKAFLGESACWSASGARPSAHRGGIPSPALATLQYVLQAAGVVGLVGSMMKLSRGG
jgi:hypothetical protein